MKKCSPANSTPESGEKSDEEITSENSKEYIEGDSDNNDSSDNNDRPTNTQANF